MPRIEHLACALALICCSTLLTKAQAQMPGIEIVTDHHQVRFAVEGEAQAMRVEVFSPSGEMVFDSGTVAGPAVEWNMRNEKGGRVADGVYLATISVKESSGKARKRIEQINVNRESPESVQPGAPNAVEATITGTGVNGKIAKFTGAATVASSVITESTEKIGIGTAGAPTARLHINGAQPADSAGDGTTATTLLQTTGGKGGKTTGAGKKGGTGASILMLAGNGGSAVPGATNGNGGSITFQPGAAGTGGNQGTGGKDGNVLIAPLRGNIGIGTLQPESKLTVMGSSTGDTLLRVENNSTGGGAVGIFGKVKGSGDGVFGASQSGNGVLGTSPGGNGVAGFSTSGYAGFFTGKVKVTNGLAVMAGGCSGCSPPSDRSLKANFSTVNPRFILNRLASVPIQTWNYRSEPASVRHMGAMAQDFRAAFNLGADDRTLDTVDAQGVTMAAIQGLYQQNQELVQEVRTLKTELQQLQRTVKQRTVRKRRARR